MATMKKPVRKYAMGGAMTTTSETTKKPKKEDKYKGLGGEIGNPIFTDKEQRERRKKLGLPTSKAEEKAYYEKMRREGAKNGKTIKKAKAGTSLGMKSVKAGYDNNSGVTRADFVSIGKGKAKSGTKLKKQAATAIAMKKAGKAPKAAMKAGGKMTKCKYGCK